MATFSIKKRERDAKKPDKEPYAIAVRFNTALRKELGEFLKAVVLFGSCGRHQATQESDIDILIVIDDVTNLVTDEVTEAYRLIVRKVSEKTSPRLHINTLKLSNFWEYVREGDPVVMNMLRDGVILHDVGIFGPAQLLLDQGRVRPSREAVWTYYTRTGQTIKSARQHLLSACVDLYWAGIDASHAALMSIGEMPASPDHVPELLERTLVKRGMLHARYPKLLKELYHLHKGILHRDVKEMTGEQFDHYWKETLELVEALRTVVERMPIR